MCHHLQRNVLIVTFGKASLGGKGGHPDLIPASSVSILMTLRAMGTYQDATRIERGRTLRAQTATLSCVTRKGRIGLLHLPGTAGSTSALLPSSSLSGA